jgi:pimeloyl-ACP methyl ester carboxylesterase
MIGHSMGGYITLAFAEKYRDHLHAFGLFHSTAFADSEEKKITRKKGIEFIHQHGAFEFLKTTIPNLFSSTFKSQIKNSIDCFIGRLSNFSPAALVSYYEAMMNRPDRTSVLKNSTIPVLFVAGEQDTAVPIEDSLKQCHLPRKTYIYILKQSAHMGMLEEPATTNCLLEKFLIET